MTSIIDKAILVPSLGHWSWGKNLGVREGEMFAWHATQFPGPHIVPKHHQEWPMSIETGGRLNPIQCTPPKNPQMYSTII